MIRREIQIKNPSGLHARPATELCDLSQEFESELLIEYLDNEIDPKSTLSILCAGVPVGSTVVLQAEGPDETQAVQAISELIASFDE